MKNIVAILFIACYSLAVHAANNCCEMNFISSTFLMSKFQECTILIFHPHDYLKGQNSDQRTLSTYSLLPKAWISGPSLMLQGVATIENLHYEIVGAEEVSVLSDYVCVRKNMETPLSIDLLPAGHYSLQLTIGEDTYVAEFEL